MNDGLDRLNEVLEKNIPVEERDWREIPAPRDHKNGGYKRVISGIRKWLYTRLGVWTSSQNLNTTYVDRKEVVKGSIWRDGRAWLLYGRDSNKSIQLAWSFWGRHKFAGLEFEIGGDETDLEFSICLWLFSIWLSFDNLFPSKWKWNDFRAIHKGVTPGFLPGSTRSTGIRFHNHTMWVQVWRDDSGWDNKVPGHWGGFDFNVDFKRLLFGREKYTTEELSVHEGVLIPMPEASYPAKITFSKATWKRPRWPFAQTNIRAEIDMQANPIPFPGKGENSWDCGEDATYSMTTSASTIDEAVTKMVGSVMRDRERNGGKNWVPEGDRPHTAPTEEQMAEINAARSAAIADMERRIAEGGAAA